MRSSKSRSRGNKNRNRPSGGNIINRVFDSSGPDGKVRGTPQQIIDKYNQLHRDAVLAGDRVAAENFAQHAEHYTRMLAEAMREVEQKREEQERQNRERQAERDRERQERLRAQEEAAGGVVEVPEGTDGDDQPDTGLVETPEAKSDDGGTQGSGSRRRSSRGRRSKAAASDDGAEAQATPPAKPPQDAPEAAE